MKKKQDRTKYRNKNNYRNEWTEEKKKTLINLWEYASYEELEKDFPGSGLGVLGNRVCKLRKEGYNIPKRKVLGRKILLWTSKVTGKTFCCTPKKRSQSCNKIVYSILVNGKRVYRHRYEMEQLLGRQLKKGEEVHHLDGNPQNDDINNLIVVDKKEHFPFDNFRANKAEQFIKKLGLWESYIKSIKNN